MTTSLITQDNRILEVTTPVGTGAFYLTAVTGKETISVPFIFNLTLMSQQQNVDATSIMNQPISFTIKLSDGETRQFNGIVNSFKKSGIGAHGIRQYEVSVVPWFWFLKNTQDCQVFQNKSIIDIFQAICTTQGFSDYDLSNLKANYQAIPYCVQYQESYFEFINRMLAEQGIAYYFKHAAGKHTMVLFDQKSPAGTPIATPFSNAPLRTPHIHEWIKERGTNSTQVVRRDYDYATPADPLISSSASGLGQASIDGVTAFSQFSYPGNYSNKSTGAALCTQAMTHLASKSYLNTGKGNVVDFSPGVRFMLGGHDDSQLNTAFLLLEVEHTAFDHSHTSGNHAAKGSDTEETHSQQYSNTFVCLPASIPYAPSPYQAKPKVAGVQSAKVLGTSPEQPHVDEYGCVKVLFEWDRYSKDAETSSCWVRVAQAWAGNGRGLQFMPRVGSEVLVSFIDGDANRPIIVGSLNNGNNLPQCKLPDNQDVSGVTTQMLGSDAASCNQLLLGDTQDKEFLLVNAAKDLSVSVVQNESTVIGTDCNLQASNLLRQITAGKHALSCGQTITLQGGMSQIVLTQSSITFTAPAIKRSGASKMMIQAKGVGGTYPIARVGDDHNCHKICTSGVHIGGPLVDGSPTFKDGGQPVSRVGDRANCHPVHDSIAEGVSSILIDGKPIARLGNKFGHGGVITSASPLTMVAESVPVAPLFQPIPGLHWITFGYFDENGQPFENMPYSVTFDDGSTKKGKLPASGKVTVRNIKNKQATKIVYGDPNAEKILQAKRQALQSALNQILSKVKAQAQKDEQQLQQHGALWDEWAEEKAKAGGLFDSLWSQAKGIADAAVTVAKIAFVGVTPQQVQAIKTKLDSLHKTIALLASDQPTREILENFAKQYANTASPLQIARIEGECTGYVIPAVAAAVLTFEAGGAGGVAVIAEDASSASASAAQALEDTADAIEAVQKVKTVTNKVTDAEHLEQAKPLLQPTRIKPGTEKYAVIGRDMKMVRPHAVELKAQGKDVEIFDDGIIPQSAQKDFEIRKQANIDAGGDGYLKGDELKNTEMYQANKAWAEKLVQQNYTIIDLGDPGKLDLDPEKFSKFYQIERQTIFGDKE